MRSGLHLVSLWFGIIMIVVVIAIAVALIFTDWMTETMYGAKRTGFIVVLLAYAVYRVFRVRQILKVPRHED